MSETDHSFLPSDVINACAARQSRLRKAMSEHQIDALLVSFDRDIQYLTNFVGDDTYVLIRPDTTEIITDSRFLIALEPWAGTGIGEPVLGIRHRLGDTIKSICEGNGIARLGVQAENLTVMGCAVLSETLGEDRVIPTNNIVPTLRMKKDDLEISLIENALRIQEEALRRALPKLQLGMTENEFFATLEYEIKWLGASGSSFAPIIAAGANSALPHYEARDIPIQEGTLLIDWGARANWYCGDLTRTYGVGHMPEKIREIYAIVLESQLAAIEACGPGKICADIDAVARKVITDAGYGEYFRHGLGHGMGIEVHEAPYFNDLQTDVALEPGMVMTVEPGIYLPGIGGVRIEDDVLITEDGYRVLSDFPKDLDSAVIEPATTASAIA